jgi:hypothetical protein
MQQRRCPCAQTGVSRANIYALPEVKLNHIQNTQINHDEDPEDYKYEEPLLLISKLIVQTLAKVDNVCLPKNARAKYLTRLVRKSLFSPQFKQIWENSNHLQRASMSHSLISSKVLHG